MVPFTAAASALLMSLHLGVLPTVQDSATFTRASTVASDVALAGAPLDSVPALIGDSVVDRTVLPIPVAVRSGLGIADQPRRLPGDTIRQPRAKAIVYSDGYLTRVTWHRRLSYAMLPLFAASYFSGDQILKKGSAAPDWARTVHGPSATGSAVLFSANTFTGAWNLWEGRRDANGRFKRIAHGVAFTVASAGFVYAGTQLAQDAQESRSKRLQHRNVALASMGVSTASWLFMLLGN